jgi:hypothetical protein
MDKHSTTDSEATYKHFKEVIAKYSKELDIRPHHGFATKAIHAAQEPETVHGSVAVPIHLSTTYAQKSPGELYSNFDYSRFVNIFSYRHILLSIHKPDAETLQETFSRDASPS